MIYIDTNILVYAFCKNVDDENQKQKAQEILKESIISNQLILSEISLYEFAFICKKLEEELEVINDNIDFLSRYIKNKLVTFDKGFKNFIKSSKTNIEIIQ
ncbi:type II toxin-antitoxin system VapC family toxin [Aliarcobacter cryaerophilus]|uniref:type II toxin-antitoxin system VapC family toxin n=1 Tax=Aliarcobacter cryaerophilus TaxID=28198 RepID=UPI003DA53564